MSNLRRSAAMKGASAVFGAFVALTATFLSSGCNNSSEEAASAPGANATPGSPDSPVAAGRNANAAPSLGGGAQQAAPQQAAPQAPTAAAAQQQ